MLERNREGFFQAIFAVNHLFNQERRKKFDYVFSYLFDCIDLMKKDEKVKDLNFGIVHETIDYIQAIVIEQPITTEVKAFVELAIDVIGAWANNLPNNIENPFTEREKEACYYVVRKNALIRRFLEFHFTTIEAIQFLRSAIIRFKSFESYVPPVFDLSKHYLDYVDKENK